VQRLLAALLVVAFILTSAGCGNVFVRGVIQPGVSSVNGFVSVIQVTVVNGTLITFVTFLNNNSPSTLGFCGDQHRRFPMDRNVRTDFNSGNPCNSIVTIVVL